jgi:hypothetical protein
VLTGGGARPSIGRRVLSAVIDPMGTTNREVFGERWSRVPPPTVYAHMAAGWNGKLSDSVTPPLHVELAVSHGLPSDKRFVPRVPFDHLLQAQLDFATDDVDGYIDSRGLWAEPSCAAAARAGPVRHPRHGTPTTPAPAIGVGPGIAAHAALGRRICRGGRGRHPGPV